MAPPRKLTMQQARMIRFLRTQGVTIAKLARDFKISTGTVQAIQMGTAYREEPARVGEKDGKEA